MNAPRELSATLLPRLPVQLVPIRIAIRSIVDAFDNVPVPLLALVVPLNGEVGEVGNQGATKGAGGSKDDALLVLRPFLLRVVDRFL